MIEDGKPVGKPFEYIDGGVELVGGKNTPVKPLVNEKKVSTIIVVYLKSESELQNKSDDPLKNRITAEDTKGKKLIEIIPSQPLGNLLQGALIFSAATIDNLIKLGYEDTCEMLYLNYL